MADRVPYPHRRVERGVGVLENNLHLSPQRSNRSALGFGDVPILKDHLTACRFDPFDSLLERQLMGDPRPIGIFDSGVGGLTVLYRWRREPIESISPTERIVGAMRAGVRYVRHDPG